MYLFLELWSAKDSWLSLSELERSEFFQRITDGVKDVLEPDCKTIGFALNDIDTDKRLDYEYLALWQMPNKETAEKFEERLRELDWYQYFHQQHMRGKDLTVEECFAHMMGR